jgi:hypothetical protein
MIQIKIPNYLRKVMVSKARRATYFGPKDKIPEKYKSHEFVFKRKGQELALFNTKTMDFVIKNPVAMGTPSYQSIAGNEIYARMHERKRMLIVDALKNDFKKHIQEQVDSIPDDMFPLSISMEIHTPYGFADWDLDNLWIYHKCFLDSLKDLHLVPDDNVLYITQAGQTTFFPVRSGEMMVFNIRQASDLPPKASELISVKESSSGEPGTFDVSESGSEATIYTGKKKILYGAAKTAIRALMLYSLNNFKVVCVPREMYQRYQSFFEENRFAGRVTIIITS